MKRATGIILGLFVALCLAPGVALAVSPLTTSAAPGASTDKAAVLEDGAVYRFSTALAGKNKVIVGVKASSSKKNTNVQLVKKSSNISQFWRAEYQGKGIYRFKNYAGGFYLGVASKVKSKANVRVQKSSRIDWRVTKNANGTFSLSPKANKKLRLSVAGGSKKVGTNLRLYTANGSKAQNFYIVKHKPLTAAAAQGKTVVPGAYSVVLKSNASLALAVGSTSRSNGVAIKLAKTTGTQSQKWDLRYKGYGLYELVNAQSGKNLDVNKSSSKVGVKVQQYERNKSLGQYYYLQPVEGGYLIRNASGGRAISAGQAPAAGVALKSAAASASAAGQVFSLNSAPLLTDGTYVLSTALVTPLVLDVKSSSKENGANVQLGRSSGIKAQQFTIKNLGDGTYRIINANSGKSLESVSTKHAANVRQNAWKGTKAQKWSIEVGPTGYMFKNQASGKYLDVQNSKRKRGANVVQANGNSTRAQCWVAHDASWKFFPKGTSLNSMKILIEAEKYEGRPYMWGGRSPSTSFDCAGLVMYCSNAVWGTKFDLIYTNAAMLYTMCKPIKAADAKPGDLVFYRGTYGGDVNYISHVVIYAGDGVMYGAGDPIGYDYVDSVKNIKGKKAAVLYARIKH